MLHFLPIQLALLHLISTHFTFDYPPARGFNEDTLANFPCGGQDAVSVSRELIWLSNYNN